MSFRIGVVGIDGSGKSTIVSALADLAAAELGLTAAAVGDDVRVKTPHEDLLMAGFAPDGEPLSARLGRWFRKAAKANAQHRQLYPPLKLVHLVLQERTVRRIAAGYRPDVIFCDGNLLISAAGRAVNYMDGETNAPDAFASVQVLYNHVVHGEPLPGEMAQRIPGLRLLRRLRQLDEWRNLGLMELPEALIFLDVEPAVALGRLKAKGGRLDRHENLQDMAQAGTMYRRAVRFFGHQRGAENLAVIDTTDLSLSQTLRQALEFVRTLPLCGATPHTEQRILGTTDDKISRLRVMARKVLTYRYLVRCILLNVHRGNARELAFPLSQLGRLFFKEGYSAGVMRAIYVRDSRRYGLFDRIFLDYPLHRAVYHRLSILAPLVEGEICRRIEQLPPSGPLKVLTAPSGYAFDLLRPLQRVAATASQQMTRIHILASDLDPDGRIEMELTRSVQRLGVGLEFVRGDLTSEETRERLERSGPYDVVLFVGLSCWIPKPLLLRHLQFVWGHLLAPQGVLFTDCFSQAAYALSGKHIGYKANYYGLQTYTSLLHYCGFEPGAISWESGPERINHVFVARVGRPHPPKRDALGEADLAPDYALPLTVSGGDVPAQVIQSA
jgi:hypothetical protein